MADLDLREQLVSLFHEVREQHHVAFAEVGGEDPEWPLWYAEQLHEGMSDLLDTYLTRDEVATALAEAERDRVENDPSANWSEYYSNWFVEAYLEGG